MNCPRKVLSDTVSVVVKYDKDVRKSLDALPRLVDPNAKVPESLPNGHSTITGTATPTITPTTITHDHAQDDRDHGTDGKAVRAAKDQPGRFTNGYYGTPKKTPTSTLGRRRAL